MRDKLSQFQGPLAVALRRWWDLGPVDPWPAECDDAVRRPEARPICLNCLMPQEQHYWFCRECGHPGGDYLVWMPYLQVFPLGEMLQRGVVGPPERRLWVTIGFVFFGALEYGVFVPIYWFWMYRRAIGRPISERGRPQLRIEGEDENPSSSSQANENPSSSSQANEQMNNGTGE